MNHTGIKKSFLIIGLLSALILNSSYIYNYFKNRQYTNNDGRVLSETDEVSVQGTVYGCILNVKAKPEKRVNNPNFWTHLTVDIYDSSQTFLGTATTTTNSDGESTVDLCQEGLTEMGGLYYFNIRGYSHLYKLYSNKPAFYTSAFDIDFTESNTLYLYAGETSVIFDNKINSLDISTQISHMYDTFDEKNDLNQDDKVNSLDISNTIYNFYMEGDQL